MDESQKQRIMLAIIAFNITIIGYQLIFNMGASFTIIKLLAGLVLAAGVAGAAYGAAMFMGK